GFLTSVSCSDAVDCTAVGEFDFAITESDGVWGSGATLSGHLGKFTSVSCTAAGDCTAVGISSDIEQGMIYATESGGIWGSVNEISVPAGAEGGQIFAVSCPATGDCTAGGVDGNLAPVSATGTEATSGVCTAVGGEPGGVDYVTESDGSWGPVTQISGTAASDLRAVSCSDAVDCTAVGSDGSYAVETNGTWGPSTVVSPPPGEGFFAGVS